MTPTVNKPPALLSKPPQATPAATATTAAFVAKPKAARAKMQPKTLADVTNDYYKVMAYGPTATGKTLIISTLLEAGMSGIALGVDFGGAGFSTVQLDMKRKGKQELLANCHMFEFKTYDEVEDFIFNPADVWEDIYSHDIDFVFLDGFSGFQMSMLEDKILGTDSLFLDQQGWGRMKTGTTRILNRFLAMKNEVTGKTWHKFVVCHENNKPKEDKVTGDMRIGPLLQGAGASVMEMSFDLIFRTRKKRVDEGGKKVTKYTYELEGTDSKILTKARGLVVPPTMPADFGVLWNSICEQKGIASGKR